jgi:tetratricopeptide (TPR) repeat protein
MFFGWLPTKTQWEKWQLPNKYTSLGLLFTLLFGLIGLPQLISWYKGSAPSDNQMIMNQQGSQNIQISGGVSGNLNLQIGNQNDIVGEYLQQAISYKKAGNVEKALEKSLEVLKVNPNSLDAIYFAASAYTVKNDVESFQKAKDILDSKLSILHTREKALLGFVEYKLNNYTRSFQILKDVNLFDLDNEITPYILVALVTDVFKTQPYSEALFHIQGLLNFIQKKAKYTQPGISKVGEDKIELQFNEDYWRILSSQLVIGDTWLVYAFNNKQIDDWIKAINIATDGFIYCCKSVNSKKDILNYLSLFNEVLINTTFLANNSGGILNSITRYIEVLEGINGPSYHIEILKLKLLYNIIIETTDSHRDKYDIYAKEEINFHLGISEIKDNVAIKSIFVKKNFTINEDLNLLSGSPPSRVFPAQKIPFKIEKESTFSKNAVFAFNVIVENMSSNAANALLIPSFFWTRFK